LLNCVTDRRERSGVHAATCTCVDNLHHGTHWSNAALAAG
jgi:hypothetical protein